jgi:aminoglycoside phosphotransferase (APT) family kinase protein
MERVRHILARALPGHALRSCEPVAGGALNPVYRIAVEGLTDRFALRIYARDPAACRKEVALHRLVAPLVPVPEILFTDPEGSPPCVLMRWVSGETWRDIELRGDARELADCGRALGIVLARIGSFTLECHDDFGPDPVPRMVERFLSSPAALSRLSPEAIAGACDFAWRRAARLATLDAERSLVHSDFGPSNVILRPGGAVAAVLDWEFAFSGSPLNDVGHALRYGGAGIEPYFSEAFRAAGGRLPEDWRDLARALDLTALAELISRPTLPDSTVPEIAALIAYYSSE